MGGFDVEASNDIVKVGKDLILSRFLCRKNTQILYKDTNSNWRNIYSWWCKVSNVQKILQT